MTDLIYRGFAHAPTSKTETRTPQDLMYRTVPHDGMNRASVRRNSAIEMCYRGISHAIAPDGRRMIETKTSAIPPLAVPV